MPVSKKRKPKAKSGRASAAAKKAIYIKGRVERTEDGRGIYFFPADNPDEFGKQYDVLSFDEKLAWERRTLDKMPGAECLLFRFDSRVIPIAISFWTDVIGYHPRDFSAWCINNFEEIRDRKFCVNPGGFLTAANAFAYKWAASTKRDEKNKEFAAKLYSAGYDLNIDEIMSCLPGDTSLREELCGWKAGVDHARIASELPPAGGEQDETLKEGSGGPSL